jgi:hypothetical protein
MARSSCISWAKEKKLNPSEANKKSLLQRLCNLSPHHEAEQGNPGKTALGHAKAKGKRRGPFCQPKEIHMGAAPKTNHTHLYYNQTTRTN